MVSFGEGLDSYRGAAVGGGENKSARGS